MDHRADKHPSNKLCNKIPECDGWVNGKKCWYFHPDSTSIQTAQPLQQKSEIVCKRCSNKFENRKLFMDHYTEKHTSHIVCRDWLKDNCKRDKCWYRHSNNNTNQTSGAVKTVLTQQDFPQIPPSHRPAAPKCPTVQLQAQTQVMQTSLTIQQMLAQMAMRMNTLELGITESRNQMHMRQEMLAKNNI